MKQHIVLSIVLSISILILAVIANISYLNGGNLGPDAGLSLFSFYFMGAFFGGIAIYLWNRKIDQDIEESFQNVQLLDEED